MIVLAAFTLLGAVLRAYRLDSGLWYDEIVTLIESVRPPLLQILTEFPGNNNHPLYSVLAHLSVSAFGEHPWALRLPAALFGVAAIPMLYVLGAAVTSRREALLASGLLTVSYHHIWFSQNARGYTALLFWTLLSTLLLVRQIENARMARALVYGAAVGLGIYTHLTMAFVAAGHAVVWAFRLWRENDRSARERDLRMAIWSFGIAGTVATLLYLPLVRQVFTFFGHGQPASVAVATPAWAVLEALKGLRVGFGIVGVLVAAAVVVLGLVSYWRQSQMVALAFTLPIFVTGAGMIVMHAPVRPRFFFNLLGFALLLVVRGAFEAGQAFSTSMQLRRTVGGGIVGLMIVVSALSLPAGYRYPKQDFEGAYQYVTSNRVEPEPISIAGLATFPLSRYYNVAWTPLKQLRDLESLPSEGARVWLVYSFPEYMAPDLVATVQERCVPQRVFPGTVGNGDVIVCTIDRQRP